MSKTTYISTPLHKVGKIVTGKTPSTARDDFYNGEYLFISPTELHDGYNITKSNKTITEKGFQSIRNNTLQGTSVLVGCIGWDMGNVAMCHKTCATNQQINSITNFNDNANPFYVYYWLSTKKEYLFSIASVTRTPILNKSTFENVEISLPKKNIQDSIASVLKSLDDKIDCNNRINTELEAMAKTLYDYWFVQFDFPNKDGKPYKSSGGTMQYNEELKRDIPEGWEVKSLGDLAFFNKESYSAKDAWENIIYLDTSSITEGCIADVQILSTKIDKIPSRAKRKVQKGDIVFSTVRPNQRHYGILGEISDNMLVSTGFATIRNKEKHISNHYIYLALTQVQMENYLQQIAEGSTSAYPSIKPSDLEAITIPCPPESLGTKFHTQVLNYYEMIDKKHKENQELAKLRDWLLPMLMNGQVAVV